MEDPKLSHSAFAQRLRACIQKMGGAGRLAEVSGLHRNTIQGYLKKYEPDRATLISLAKGAGVSPEWLTTGFDVPTSEHMEASSEIKIRRDYIRTRLERLIERCGGKQEFVAATGLSTARVDELLKDAEMTASEASQICRSTETPPGWLLWGKGFDATDYNHVKMLSERLVSDLALVEEGRAGFVKLSFSGAWNDGDLLSVFHFFRKVFERLPPARYHIREIQDNAMSPTLEPKDVVVVQEGDTGSTSGIFMFRKGTKFEFFARGIAGGELLTFSFDNDRYKEATASRLLSPDSETECVGRVVAVFGPPY